MEANFIDSTESYTYTQYNSITNSVYTSAVDNYIFLVNSPEGRNDRVASAAGTKRSSSPRPETESGRKSWGNTKPQSHDG